MAGPDHRECGGPTRPLSHPRRRLILQPAFFRIVRTRVAGLAVLLAPAFVLAASADDSKGPWQFRDGDRIVLVGDTLIERDQRYGYLETFLTAAHPDLGLTFRNLGWSGDTVRGLSRAGFDPPEAGFKALRDQVLAARPTVLIVGYGMADSFDGEAGLPRFISGLNEFLDAVAGTKARVIFLSPIEHEDLGRPLPDPTSHNRDLARYAEAVRQVAAERDARFVKLLGCFPNTSGGEHHTDNGIHLNERGYRQLARVISSSLGMNENSARGEAMVVRSDGSVIAAAGRSVTEMKPTATGLRFVVQRKTLPESSDTRLRFVDLPPGRYALRIDGKPTASGDASDWAKGMDLKAEPDLDQTEALRKTINAKNTLFFYRWRPQNITYLFGFRKHEQGNNAVEIPKFDPLVEAKEREIARLRKPVPHVYELVQEGEAAK